MKKRFLRFLSLVMATVTMMSFLAVDTAALTTDEAITPKVPSYIVFSDSIVLNYNSFNHYDNFLRYNLYIYDNSSKKYNKINIYDDNPFNDRYGPLPKTASTEIYAENEEEFVIENLAPKTTYTIKAGVEFKINGKIYEAFSKPIKLTTLATAEDEKKILPAVKEITTGVYQDHINFSFYLDYKSAYYDYGTIESCSLYKYNESSRKYERCEGSIVSGLKPGTTYKFKACARVYKRSSKEVINQPMSEVITVTTRLFQPKISVSSGKGCINVKYDEVENADKYYIYRSSSEDKSFKLIAKTSKLSYADKDVKKNETYSYKIKAVKLSGEKEIADSDFSNTEKTSLSNLSKPVIKAETVSDSKIKISWNKINDAERYYIYYSTKKDADYKCIGYSEKLNYTFSKLKKGSKYYFKIRASRTVDGEKVYSAYSATVSQKTLGDNGVYIVDFDKITNKQYNMPNGSAMTTLAMIINYYGKEYNISTTPDELVKYFRCTDVKVVDGVERIEEDCYGTFAGDPYSSKNCPGIDGWGEIMAWTRFCKDVDVEGKIIGNGFIGYWDNFSGVKEYLNKGKISICLIETSSNPKDIKLEYKHALSSTGYSVTYYTKTSKYVILCGYTDTDYIFYDPATGKYESYLATNQIISHFIPICDYATAKWYAMHS